MLYLPALDNPDLIAALIGHPVQHSRSPFLHNRWLGDHDMSATYGLLDIAPQDLSAAIDTLRRSALRGFNITIPHKINMMAQCDVVDDTARLIGAVNTVLIKDQKLYGYNTDAFGFSENLKQAAPDFDISAGAAVVLGAGGAARAALYALQDHQSPQIYLLNRTRETAESLAQDFKNITVIDWDQRSNIIADTHLLINTTSLGMREQPSLDIHLSALPLTSVVYDLVYNPMQTPLLQDAASRGNIALGGLGMLVYQAAKAFEIWFEKYPHVTRPLLQELVETL